MAEGEHAYNGPYTGDHLSRVAFPMGGLGAGMICLEGSGCLSHVSLRHQPDVFNEPTIFSAIAIKGRNGKPNIARLLEGPLPMWKAFGLPGAGNGLGGRTYGLPRFSDASFEARFPFATLNLTDETLPVAVELVGWSPFEPGDSNNSSLPVAALEYTITNTSDETVDAVYSFNTKNLMARGGGKKAIKGTKGGFILIQEGTEEDPQDEGAFVASVTDPQAKTNLAWFRGGWWDSVTMAWKDIQEAACYDREAVADDWDPPGATIFVPITLKPGKSKTVTLQLAWHVGVTSIRLGEEPADMKEVNGKLPHHAPWYAGRFADVEDVAEYWRKNYSSLREASARFRDCFYDSTLPAEVLEAVSANMTILKSPTVLRQKDGRLWAWEGCTDSHGCCHGSCTHVWNYAQAIPHLFPDLERTLRETEFGPSQADTGHQTFRAMLPIRQAGHAFHAASDGQLGGIMKIHREWRISGDTKWLRGLWDEVKQSLDYCITTWDPKRKGYLEEPHHNTYDIEFWGPNGMCTSFYLGALAAAVAMGQALSDDVNGYEELLRKGTAFVEKELFNGEYYIQKVQWTGLEAGDPTDIKGMVGKYSPEAEALLRKEGPKYQYGNGCISDGVLGSWMALVCGVGQVMDTERVTSHLVSIHKYNLKHDLLDHANPQRPTFACGPDGGLLLCTWPKGDQPSLPFVYSNEVWTGIEYQVASHLMLMGRVQEGLEIVRVCRDRYDGRVRNPFNEYECGHWYARALASYGLLQGLTGVRYDAVDKTLHIAPRIAGDFQSFLSTATGYGHAGVKDGKPFLNVVHGKIDVKETAYVPYEA